MKTHIFSWFQLCADLLQWCTPPETQSYTLLYSNNLDHGLNAMTKEHLSHHFWVLVKSHKFVQTWQSTCTKTAKSFYTATDYGILLVAVACSPHWSLLCRFLPASALGSQSLVQCIATIMIALESFQWHQFKNSGILVNAGRCFGQSSA